MNLILILLIVMLCYIQLKYYDRPQIIDVEWQKVSHVETLQIYEQILNGEIEIYEN